MLDFIKWCEAKNLELPMLGENNKRTGIRGQYPDGYVRSQYPDGFFPPITASSLIDLKNTKYQKSVKDKGETPVK